MEAKKNRRRLMSADGFYFVRHLIQAAKEC